mgnify:FL=1
MKKISTLIAIVAMTLLSASISSCSGKNDEPRNPNNPQSDNDKYFVKITTSALNNEVPSMFDISYECTFESGQAPVKGTVNLSQTQSQKIMVDKVPNVVTVTFTQSLRNDCVPSKEKYGVGFLKTLEAYKTNNDQTSAIGGGETFANSWVVKYDYLKEAGKGTVTVKMTFDKDGKASISYEESSFKEMAKRN